MPSPVSVAPLHGLIGKTAPLRAAHFPTSSARPAARRYKAGRGPGPRIINQSVMAAQLLNLHGNAELGPEQTTFWWFAA